MKHCLVVQYKVPIQLFQQHFTVCNLYSLTEGAQVNGGRRTLNHDKPTLPPKYSRVHGRTGDNIVFTQY